MKSIYYIALFFVLISCSSQEIPERVFEVRNIGELSTTEYTVGKIIKVEDSEENKKWYEYGDHKILLSCQARIKAGIDLSKLKESDITVKGNAITILLPPAEITSFTIDPKSVKTEMESVTGWRSKYSQKEKTAILQQAETSIKEDMAETGILEDANDNAIYFLEDFYKQMGFKKVTVKASPTNYE